MNMKRDIAFYHMVERRGWRPRHPAVGDGLSVPLIFPCPTQRTGDFLCSAKKFLKNEEKSYFQTQNNTKCNKDVTMCGYNIMHGRVSFRYSAAENKVCRGSNPLFNGIEPAAGRRR